MNNRIIKSIFILCIVVLFNSCKKEITRQEAAQLLKDENSGLVKSKEFMGLDFTVNYVPSILFDNANVSRAENNSEEDSIVYFMMTISDKGRNKSPLKSRSVNRDDYNNKLYYLQTKLKDDFKLFIENKEFDCLFLNHEEEYNLTGKLKCLVAFKVKNITDDITVKYNDKLFGIGLMSFKFKLNDLESLINKN